MTIRVWTNATRPVSPGEDLLGFNDEERRHELYTLAEDKWYFAKYGWQVPMPPPPDPALFTEDFETDWFTALGFDPLMTEGFDVGWPVAVEGWAQLAVDGFEIGWYSLREFDARLVAEGFETGWFVDHPFSPLFAEGFEGVW